MDLEEIKKLTEQGEEEYFEDLEKGIRPGFGSPGGKRYLAKTIVSYIPEHKTYIEPFIGGGAVFFAKEPSKVEVINDLDKEITFAYRFMKNITDEQFKALKSKNWKASKILFEKLKNLKTDDPLEKFRKIVYLKKLSYGESGKNYDQTNEGRDLTNGLDSLLKIKERLKNVKIENNDYKKSINYDSKKTFYYLDPPYTETNNVGNIDLVDLHKFCKNLRGKFILSLNNIKKNVDIFKNFNIKKVKVSQQMFTGGSQMQMRTELLISNFPLKKENIYLAKSDEVLIEDLPSFVWIDSFLSLAGSILYERENNRKPNDIDVIVRAKEEDGKFIITLDKSLRLKIDRVLEKRVGKISGKWLTPEWLGSTFGPNWRYQTGWDLVLVPHQPQEIREMNEPEFAEEFYKARHSREKCMRCDKPPVYECLWAEGIGHAWFCKEHFKEWATTGDGKGEIISVKEVKDGIAAKKFGDNRNPNVWAELNREFSKDEGMEKKLSDKQGEEYDKETAIINENKEKPQAKEVHGFKVAKYTHPNGHPRCLTCGDEEPIGGVCNMPDSWYQKHEFDDEEAWKREREILREKGVMKQGTDVDKLDLEQFRAEGIDDDLKNPAVRHKELFAGLRYIGNSGYPKLKEGKKWGEWKLENALKYYAAIVDTLRSVYFPVTSPKIGDKEYKTSYWECYREARRYMKSKPPAEKEVKEWDEKRKKIIKDGQEIAKFTFKKIDEVEHIVGGVVYFSYKEDSQEDWTTPPEVWKALKRFMLKKKKLKVMHEGKEREIPIIENYFVEEQHHKGGTSPKNLLEKGDWWLAVYLGDRENKDIWERVLKGELTGFSIAGRASSPS